MKFYKKIVLGLAFLFLATPQTFAQEKQFEISQDSFYKINEDGTTDVTKEISIKNLTEFYYTPSYTVNVGVNDVSNIQASNAEGSIPTTINSRDENKSIKLSFPQRNAGLNEVHSFTLEFKTKDILKKNGNIWEISVPGVENADEFDNYTIEIEVPESFGDSLISKPASNDLIFSKEELGHEGVYVVFGDVQYFKFELKYNISNPNLFPVRTEIALPPSTNYQNSIISSFSLEPDNVKVDNDKNWIAEYRLLPQERKTVEVTGLLEVLKEGKREELNNKQIEEYTKPLKYWETKSKEIEEAARQLEDVEDIYNFVRDNLSYNKSKIATDALRLGGKGALLDPKNSVCLEYTDLFISLARAKGIPARAVEGFAFTGGAGNRPLSLVSDILHAWPEYYNFETKSWVMVDPTWGDTTGLDYFNSLDFSHVTFVVKGYDSEYPIPAGGYKFSSDTKDVEMSFASKEDFKRTKGIKLSEDFPEKLLPKFVAKGTIKVANTGNFEQENIEVIVESSKGTVRKFNIDYLPPYGHRQITTSFSDTPFLTNEPYKIKIAVDDRVLEKEIEISFIPDLKVILLIGGIILVSTITAAVTFHTGSLLVQRRKRKSSIRR